MCVERSLRLADAQGEEQSRTRTSQDSVLVVSAATRVVAFESVHHSLGWEEPFTNYQTAYPK